ncbi:MAG: helicase C-terminal domain-containing protein, partial [Myxococcota bacterium]
KWLCELVANVPYRLALSATPAPNSHYEYATHARFLNRASTVKEYASRFFRKDGNKWILRGHAEGPFYDNLSTWSTYVYSPRALGYEASTEMDTEPDYVYHRVGIPPQWQSGQRTMFASASVGKLRPRIYGNLRTLPGPRLDAIAEYAEGKRCVVWVKRNKEEETIAAMLRSHGATVGVINGRSPIEERIETIDAYRNGQIQHLVSKPSVMGFGVNLPECDHMIYSGFDDSFEQFYQAVRRAHRYGRNGRLEVMIPYTDPESPILSNLRRKQDRFKADCIAMQSRFWKRGDG